MVTLDAKIPDGPIDRGFDYYHGFHHARNMEAVIENDRLDGVHPEGSEAMRLAEDLGVERDLDVTGDALARRMHVGVFAAVALDENRRHVGREHRYGGAGRLLIGQRSH